MESEESGDEEDLKKEGIDELSQNTSVYETEGSVLPCLLMQFYWVFFIAIDFFDVLYVFCSKVPDHDLLTGPFDVISMHFHGNMQNALFWIVLPST